MQLPYNIGIIGHYGSGKSKIIEQVKKELKSNINNGVPVKIVTFDVGRYHSSEHIWSALIYAFFDEFKKDKKVWASWDFFKTLSGWEITKSIISIIIAILGTIALIYWYYVPVENKIEIVFKILPSILSLWAIWKLIGNIKKIWLHPAVAGSIDKIATMPLHLVKEFENRITFESKLRRLFKAWVNESSGERIVLFIENLDRCSKKHVIEIVDELYALISTPEIEKKLICIVSVDDDALAKAIKESHGDNANEYFEKLFSLKLHLPKLAGIKLSRFLNELTGYKPRDFFSADTPELSLNYENYRLEDDEKEFISQMLGGANNREGVTPRKAKRVISSYQFLKYIWPSWFVGTEFHPEILASTVLNCLSGKKKKFEGAYKEAAELIGKICVEDKKKGAV